MPISLAPVPACSISDTVEKKGPPIAVPGANQDFALEFLSDAPYGSSGRTRCLACRAVDEIRTSKRKTRELLMARQSKVGNGSRMTWSAPELRRLSAGSAEAGQGNFPDGGGPNAPRS